MSHSAMLLALTLLWQPPASQKDLTLDDVQVTLVKQVQVSAREPGILEQVKVEAGTLVKQHDELGRVEDDKPRMDLKRSQVELEIAQAESESDVPLKIAEKAFKVSQAEYRRASEAHERFPDAVSQTQLDRLKFLTEKSSLEIEEAKRQIQINKLKTNLKQAEVETTDLNVRRRKILAPLAGMVVEVHKHPGEWVEPGDPVLRIVQLNPLRAETFLKAKQFGLDIVGTPVTFVANLPGEPNKKFSGKIVFANPEVEVDGQFRVRAEIENDALKLRPGVQGTLTIHFAAKTASKRPAEESR